MLRQSLPGIVVQPVKIEGEDDAIDGQKNSIEVEDSNTQGTRATPQGISAIANAKNKTNVARINSTQKPRSRTDSKTLEEDNNSNTPQQTGKGAGGKGQKAPKKKAGAKRKAAAKKKIFYNL